ncbi:MAG: hypothetical protein EA349_09500, partial [Halomonadaceae bacterium]
MKKTLLLSALVLFASTPVNGNLLDGLLRLPGNQPEQGNEQVQLIVTRFNQTDIISELLSNGRLVDAWGLHEVLLVDADRAEAVKALLERLPGVRNVVVDAKVQAPEPDYSPAPPSMSALAMPDSGSNTASTSYNDPGYGEQFHWRDRSTTLKGASSIAAAVAKAQAQERLSIAILDTGFQHHDAFTWAGGYNFWGQDNNGPKVGGEYATWPDYKNCTQNHGQIVGSVLGAPQNSGSGITGMLEADYYGVRVAGCNGSGNLSTMAQGIRWAAGDRSLKAPAIANRAQIINISMAAQVGSRSCPGYLQEAIDFARHRGAIIVASAGNSPGVPGEEIAPANCRGVIAVGAVDRQGNKASFSTSGSNLAYSALGQWVPVEDRQGYYTASGTSFSAPIVSGMLALLWQTVPALTASEVTAFSIDSTTAFGNTGGHAMGRGVLNGLQLLESAVNSIFQPELRVAHPFESDCQGDLIAQFHSAQLNVCDLREIILSDERMADNRFAVLYSVPQGKALRSFNGQVVMGQASRQFVLREWDRDRQYGLQICDQADGTGCDSTHLGGGGGGGG